MPKPNAYQMDVAVCVVGISIPKAHLNRLVVKEQSMNRRQPALKSVPMVTGQVSEELGITISKEFIIRKLKVKPLLLTKTSAYWDDISLIKARLGAYFTKASKL
jgi:hypothetical protein